MSLRAALPDLVSSVAELQQLDAAAVRLTTPCLAGELVWRVWRPAAGLPGAAPVLLLHGGSGSWMHWVRNIVPLLRAGRCVVVPDLPGFGESAPLRRSDDADAVPAWLDAGLQLLQPTLHGAPPAPQGLDVVGFSFGGLIAGLLALHHAPRVRRLVLVGAPALYLDRLHPLVLRPWIHLPRGSAERADAQACNLRSLMLAHARSVDALALWINTTNLERDRMRQRRQSRSDLLGRALPQLQMPVWGVWGAEDVLVRDELHRVAPVLAQAPHCRGLHTIAGAGHWVQYEDAPAFNRRLREILAAP